MAENSLDYQLAPRMQFTSANVLANGYKVDANLMLIDTAQEKDIGLAPDYPFEPLGVGECILPEVMFQKNVAPVAVGDTVTISFKIGDLLDVMAEVFNTEPRRKD